MSSEIDINKDKKNKIFLRSAWRQDSSVFQIPLYRTGWFVYAADFAPFAEYGLIFKMWYSATLPEILEAISECEQLLIASREVGGLKRLAEIRLNVIDAFESCERCGKRPAFSWPSRTIYAWDGVGEDPNVDKVLCKICGEEYSRIMQEQWDEYNRGRI